MPHLFRWLGFAFVAASILTLGQASPVAAQEARPPNVLLIITDDQGYGDLGIHGNTMLKTPNLDALARQSVRLTNFHCDPTCAETRAALMTGRYSCRTGVWHTIMGRSILRRDEKLMPQFFGEAGYQTAAFGKWHLGDNYPYRPQDRGFDESLVHGGGGVGQTPDHWNNDYFDDTYRRNGQPEKQEGYCTDVWFANATKFIEQHRDKPFFCYVATNAPHSPYNVDPKFAQPYLDQGVPQPMANFYGMIANVDQNVGRLLRKLDDWQLSENTIVVFMTDNGTAAGVLNKPKAETQAWKGFSAGMRAQKGSQYDGGHRVPCFIRLPDSKPGGYQHADTQVATLAAHFDLLPTLAELCQLQPPPSDRPWDGHSLVDLISGRSDKRPPREAIVVHSQRVEHPEKWRKTAVMSDRWRLVDGRELYDIQQDPGQQRDVAAQHGDVVAELTKFYDKWWTDVSQRFDGYSNIVLGADEANPVELNCHDWHPTETHVPWNQSGQEGVKGDPAVNGFWAVEVEQAGKYEFVLRARPDGVEHPLAAKQARVRLGEQEATAEVPAAAEEARLTLSLPAGPGRLQTWLEGGAQTRGAYYVQVRRLD